MGWFSCWCSLKPQKRAPSPNTRTHTHTHTHMNCLCNTNQPKKKRPNCHLSQSAPLILCSCCRFCMRREAGGVWASRPAMRRPGFSEARKKHSRFPWWLAHRKLSCCRANTNRDPATIESQRSNQPKVKKKSNPIRWICQIGRKHGNCNLPCLTMFLFCVCFLYFLASLFYHDQSHPLKGNNHIF